MRAPAARENTFCRGWVHWRDTCLTIDRCIDIYWYSPWSKQINADQPNEPSLNLPYCFTDGSMVLCERLKSSKAMGYTIFQLLFQKWLHMLVFWPVKFASADVFHRYWGEPHGGKALIYLVLLNFIKLYLAQSYTKGVKNAYHTSRHARLTTNIASQIGLLTV